MSTITVTIPDEMHDRVVAAMRDQFPQYALLQDDAALTAVAAQYWRNLLVAYEVNIARSSADTTINQTQQASLLDAQSIS